MSETEKVFAFPVTDNVNGGEEGMELRDWFAGQVIPHIYAKYVEFANDHGYDEEWKNNLADEAFNIADAMMEARKK